MASIAENPNRFSFVRGLRAYRDIFRFSGRSRRLEVAEFYVVSAIVIGVVRLLKTSQFMIRAGSPAESFLATQVTFEALNMLLILPLIALTARRIQDLGFPGWPVAPLMLYVMATNAWESIAVVTYAYPPAIWKTLAFLAPTEVPSGWWKIAAMPIVVGLVIVWFAPGTPGRNRYGSDPREA